ncbi:MAG: AarF/ABC1/UbiB kinase family protein [Prochloraceae cyanobacterium]|nr:AarF/ABC1/UbiB kinase family protein [Prochloraceae cyanobacterium]
MLVKNAPSHSLPWQNSKPSPRKRQIEIFSVAFQFGLYLWFDNLLGKNSPKQRYHRANWLVKQILKLGPTFIKIGQSLSTRPDLIPLEYVRELATLQDKVPPFNSDEAIAIIESEFGKSIYSLYRDFEARPLASASIGQVHKAILHTGEDVVVKVQRPGLEALFNLDFEVLHRVVRISSAFFSGLKKYNLESIYQEFFEVLFLEVDYIHEGKNADRFRHNFSNYDRVCVPQVHWQYTTKRVLTLEYLPGIKIDDRASLEANNIDTDEIIELGVFCYLKQLLEDGFFQSDPHPGNMAVSSEGKIVFYDFGTMVEVKSMAKDQMVETFFAVIKKDIDEIVENLTYMGLIEPMPDMTPVKRLVSFIFENFTDKPIDVKAFEQIGDELYIMFKQQPFRLPAQMTFILKSITTLDGIARALNPRYNIISAIQPFVKNLVVANSDGKIISALIKQASKFVKQKWQQPSRSELLIKRLENRIELGELQVRVRSRESDRALQKIHLALKSLIYACLSGFSLVAAVLLLNNYLNWAIVGFCFSSFWFLILFRSLFILSMQEKIDKIVRK